MTDPLRLVVFDCDGTLVDSQAMILAAMRRAYAGIGLAEPDPAAVRRVVGLSLGEAMAVLLPDLPSVRQAAVADAYKNAFYDLRQAGADREEALFPDIVRIIDLLDGHGYLLGVATGKSTRGLHATLQRHGLRDRFVTLQTADDHPSKPHPSMLETAIAEAGAAPERTVMIGDTSYDIAMAVNARVAGIGVDWGYHAPEDLHRAGAAHIVSSAAQLPDLIGTLIG